MDNFKLDTTVEETDGEVDIEGGAGGVSRVHNAGIASVCNTLEDTVDKYPPFSRPMKSHPS